MEFLQQIGTLALTALLTITGFIGGLFEKTIVYEGLGGVDQACFVVASRARLSGSGVSASESSIGLTKFVIPVTSQQLQ